MEEIIVRSQEELDAVPVEKDCIIKIEFGTYYSRAVVRNKYKYSVVARGKSSVVAWDNSSVVARDNSSVEARDKSSVVAWDNSSVVALGNSSVVARDNSSVVAWENSSVVAWDNSSVEARGNSSVVARGKSSVVARGKSSVVAWDNSSVVARDNSSVEARGNSSVVAWENSSVVAWENSSVVAWEKSSVVAWENSSVVALGNSSVVARGNSSVEARGNSSVVAYENVQVVDYLQGATIQLFGNARTVFMPKNIEEFMNFYGIEHDKTTATFFKAVHKRKVENFSTDCKSYEYVSNYDNNFKYEINKIISSNCFDDDIEKDCGEGIHISSKNWALNFGKNWKDIALLEVKVKIKDILLPRHSNGKVRAQKVEVVREVPLEECGVYGKILAKRKDK